MSDSSKGRKRALTDDQIAEMRADMEAGKGGKELARKFGVSEHVVSRIRKGRVGGGAPLPRPRSLTDEQAGEAKVALAHGVSVAEVARGLGVARAVIASLADGKSYQDIK